MSATLDTIAALRAYLDELEADVEGAWGGNTTYADAVAAKAALPKLRALAERAALVDAVREVWPNAFAAPLASMGGVRGVVDRRGRQVPRGSWGVWGCGSDFLPVGPTEAEAWADALVEAGRKAKGVRDVG